MSDIQTLAILVLGGAFDATELGENDIQPASKLIEELQQRLVTDFHDVYIELINRADLDRVTAERDALQLLLNDRDEQLHTLEQSRRSHFDNAQAAERRIEELTRHEHEPVNWAAPKTVRQLIRQLQTLDPDMETHAMLRIPDFKDGKQVRSCPLSISYERMEGPWLSSFKGDGRKVIAIWAKPDHRDPQDQGETLTESAES
ncbi:hypothetical protein ACQR3P_18340 [Rhodococcus sp. IEGM1300]